MEFTVKILIALAVAVAAVTFLADPIDAFGQSLPNRPTSAPALRGANSGSKAPIDAFNELFAIVRSTQCNDGGELIVAGRVVYCTNVELSAIDGTVVRDNRDQWNRLGTIRALLSGMREDDRRVTTLLVEARSILETLGYDLRMVTLSTLASR